MGDMGVIPIQAYVRHDNPVVPSYLPVFLSHDCVKKCILECFIPYPHFSKIFHINS